VPESRLCQTPATDIEGADQTDSQAISGVAGDPRLRRRAASCLAMVVAQQLAEPPAHTDERQLTLFSL
jgi:hypothetical protein